SRRRFLGRVTLAGAAGLLGLHARPVAAEPSPETTRLRVDRWPAICFAPKYVAEELLHGEGFTDVHYVPTETSVALQKAFASGDVHFGLQPAGVFIPWLDAGDPIIVLAGLHVGCYELFGTDQVHTIRDLQGKTVSVSALGSGRHAFLASMLAYVGLDPRKDITLVTPSPAESMQLLAEGKIDAFMAFPPEPQELRARKIGHVLVNTTVDRPWSQYFCCMALGNREFVRKNPVATKRVLRAILKGADICALQPDRAARFVMDKRYTRPDYALQVLKELPYGKWREYDPADTVRFGAVRPHGGGMMKSSPQKIMAQGTDWRFLNELKKELKG